MTARVSNNGQASPPVAAGKAGLAAALWAALRLRCPRCRKGRVFHGSFAMNTTCPVCGLRFEREPGYFLGAMYFSYFLSIPLIGALLLFWLWLWRGLAWEWQVLLAGLSAIPFAPWLFRISRVLWIYFDRWVSPGEHGG
jgi:uncharacterized protein (DUF983 family)